MNSFQSSLYTAALALCLFSAGIFGGRRSRTGAPFTYFTAFLIIESLGFVFELLMVHPATPLKALWLGLRMAASLLVAPCLWLALRKTVEGNHPGIFSLGRKHLALIWTGIALTLPLIGSAHLGTTYSNPSSVMSPSHARIIHGAMLLCIAIFGWQGMHYLWRCRGLLLQQLNRQNATTPPTGSTSAITWLHLPLIAVGTTWILGLLRTVHCASHAPKEFAVLFSFTDVSVTVGAIYLMVKRASSAELLPAPPEQPPSTEPEVIREIVALPVSPVTAIGLDVLNLAPATPVEVFAEPKYRKCNLPAPVRNRIKTKLETAFAGEKIYRDSLLNLRSLSASLKENAHYVSQVINQELNLSFYQLVNQYRIGEAKQLLVNSPDQTVLEIALFVGFNAKSTFNTAFRLNTGMTPREYRLKQSC